MHHYNSTQYCKTETIVSSLYSPSLWPTSHLRCCQVEVRGGVSCGREAARRSTSLKMSLIYSSLRDWYSGANDSNAPSCAVFEIYIHSWITAYTWNLGWGHSRSLKKAPLDRSYATSYQCNRPIGSSTDSALRERCGLPPTIQSTQLCCHCSLISDAVLVLGPGLSVLGLVLSFEGLVLGRVDRWYYNTSTCFLHSTKASCSS